VVKARAGLVIVTCVCDTERGIAARGCEHHARRRDTAWRTHRREALGRAEFDNHDEIVLTPDRIFLAGGITFLALC
jgi:hypothetical protein